MPSTDNSPLPLKGSPLPPVIFLMGPTASGKTAVAIELLQRLPVEIISVDSALVYREMNIGTAKPDAATLAHAPHHLIDLIDPTESYSAAAFRRAAIKLMADITARGKIPLLVGGTMLYFKALRDGLSPLPIANPAVRTELDALIAQHGVPWLHQQLSLVDAVTAARLSPNDSQRIQRAMEVYQMSGQPMSALLQHQETVKLPYQISSISLLPNDRSILHQRIAMRFKQMKKTGLVEELQQLRQRYDLHPELPAMRCVGYRQAWQFMEGAINESQFLETGIIATRQLAKRQLTWLRSMPENIAIDCFASDLNEQVHRALRL
ncbi:MAG: tRNA (adenosine(37)-N6)-dimethylallyltransferase MiaA [Gallionella sp.]